MQAGRIDDMEDVSQSEVDDLRDEVIELTAQLAAANARIAELEAEVDSLQENIYESNYGEDL